MFSFFKSSHKLKGEPTNAELDAESYEPIALRYLILSTQSKKFDWDELETAQNSLHRLRLKVKKLPPAEDNLLLEDYLKRFKDTTHPLPIVWEMLHSEWPANYKASTLREMDKVLGLNLF